MSNTPADVQIDYRDLEPADDWEEFNARVDAAVGSDKWSDEGASRNCNNGLVYGSITVPRNSAAAVVVALEKDSYCVASVVADSDRV